MKAILASLAVLVPVSASAIPSKLTCKSFGSTPTTLSVDVLSASHSDVTLDKGEKAPSTYKWTAAKKSHSDYFTLYEFSLVNENQENATLEISESTLIPRGGCGRGSCTGSKIVEAYFTINNSSQMFSCNGQ